MGVGSGCGEQEEGVASGSGWNLWVWLVGVVVRRTGDKRLETGKRPSNRMRDITNIKRVYIIIIIIIIIGVYFFR